jgi:uncharacterized protein YecT (DUF1311 family)
MKPHLLTALTLLVITSASAEVTDPCATQNNTLEINACAAAELAAKDKELNKAYEKLMKSLVAAYKDDTTNYKAVKENLAEAQRNWIKFRDQDCNAKYQLNESGTIRNLVALSCKIEHTEQRTRQLRNWNQL